MTAFIVAATLMVVAAVVWIMVPLLRHGGRADVARDASNLAILRNQLRELETDLANGTLSREQYEQSKQELERRVLDEVAAEPRSAEAGAARSGAVTAAILALAIPAGAVALYAALGDFGAFSPQTQAASKPGPHDFTPEQIEEMIQRVVARLEKEPDNVEGWIVLARTYNALQRYPEAAKAFEKAVALEPNDANLLADYADVLAVVQGGSISGRPMELIDRALKADPKQWKALALAGTEAFNRKDYKAAVGYWERLKAVVPPDAPIAQSIDGSIAEARQLGGLKAESPRVAGAPAAPQAVAVPGSMIAGSVALSPALLKQAQPGDTVFIFARAAEGPRMPLAIVRKQVKDLPATFTLDDSQAMAPNMKLSNFTEVVVGARVSKTGSAMPQSGDLEGLSAPVKVGASGVAIVIDRALP